MTEKSHPTFDLAPIKTPPPQSGSADTQVRADVGVPVTAQPKIAPSVIDAKNVGAVLKDFVDEDNLYARIALAAQQDAAANSKAVLKMLNDCEVSKQILEKNYHDEREKRLLAEQRGEHAAEIGNFRAFLFTLAGVVGGVGGALLFEGGVKSVFGGVLITIAIVLFAKGRRPRPKGKQS